jgi:endonuclease/exonuclease/phosphatase family metal-dependent hydrolase
VNLLQAFLIKPLISIMRLIGMVKPKFEPFKDALKRLNQMVIMRLSPIGATPESNKSFVVGTYHMPCMFDYPQVMVIHCALSAQHIQNYSQGDPYIFAGDFNVKPTDSMYRLLTQGDIDEKVN